MPLFTTTASQVTNNGRSLQAKNHDFLSIDKVLPQTDMASMQIGSAYIHVPFCFHKCHYCDFYSIVDNRDRQEAFTNRLIQELNAASEYLVKPVKTVFVGGGTPTLLKAKHWMQLLPIVRQRLGVQDNVEFTIEANPETVTAELAAVLVEGGVNRVSIGCQSFNPKHLKTLERWHDPQNVYRSVEILRGAGIQNLNLDLIFAIPGQTLNEWLVDLETAIALRPEHISCYGLTFEPNTPMTVKMKAGAIQPAEQDLEADMYLATMRRLHEAGYDHYEISNWALQTPDQPGQNRCHHNLAYWNNANWWAFGPSASGHVNGMRWKNIPRLSEYLDCENLPPITDVEQLDEDGRVGEQLMLRLRLIEGIDKHTLDKLLSCGTRAASRRQALSDAMQRGLIAPLADAESGGAKFTQEGLLQADSVIAQLL
jgi:oxygen-independent coproporphyrinogen-3 oxidase